MEYLSQRVVCSSCRGSNIRRWLHRDPIFECVDCHQTFFGGDDYELHPIQLDTKRQPVFETYFVR